MLIEVTQLKFSMKRWFLVIGLLCVIIVSGNAHKPQRDSLPNINLNEVAVVKQFNHLNGITKVDLSLNPVNSSQEVLRYVPGLFIAQHAGGGKAEQMFLRGFDIDHGTDINITVDGIPVNMVSHAHGQGYADLHFLQPETIESIDFDKGPFNAQKGDLATAGYVAFKTKDRVNNEATIEIGQFNTWRYRSSLSLLNNEDNSFYVSASYLHSDGYFKSPQNFKRLNLMSKYSHWSDHSRFNIIISHFNSSWNASGQIPDRAVKNGLISRFGAIDDTEGGYTSRSDINFIHAITLDNGATIKSNAWLSHYSFDLYSNFTFFLNDSVNGDQINQRENRLLGGASTEFNKTFNVNNTKWDIKGGASFRYDQINDIALYHTVSRKHIGTFSLGDIGESSLSGYLSANIEIGKWLINPALRVDYFTFDYADKLQPQYSNPRISKTAVSPKLNFMYKPNPDLQLFLKSGKGFHSNDARVVVLQKGKSILPAGYGVDLGLLWKATPGLVLNATGWFLWLDQEFVYVGDEAIVEPNGKTRRFGLDLGLRWQFLKNFYLQADYTYCHARSAAKPEGENYIPLAPVHTFVAGLNYSNKGFDANLRCRFMGNRPANEDYSITADGYFVADFNASYTYRMITIGTFIENIFNAKWKEAQFATETRLLNEPQYITELHYTPGTPFNAKAYITIHF